MFSCRRKCEIREGSRNLTSSLTLTLLGIASQHDSKWYGPTCNPAGQPCSNQQNVVCYVEQLIPSRPEVQSSLASTGKELRSGKLTHRLSSRSAMVLEFDSLT
jgi:hypothetical protein